MLSTWTPPRNGCSESRPAWFALATAIFLVQLVIGALRWRAVLDAIGAPLPFARAVRFFFIGAFFSQTLPSSVGGDAVRIYKTWRAGLTLGAAVNGVMLERIAAVVALVALVAGDPALFLPRVGEDTAGWIGSAVALGVAATVAGMVVLLVLRPAAGVLARLAPGPRPGAARRRWA